MAINKILSQSEEYSDDYSVTIQSITPFSSESARIYALNSPQFRTEHRSFSEMLSLCLSCRMEHSDLTIKEAITLKACTDALKDNAKAREWIERIPGEFPSQQKKENELVLANILNPDSARPLQESVDEISVPSENPPSETQDDAPSEILKNAASEIQKNITDDSQETAPSDSPESPDSENSSRILHAQRENIRKNRSVPKKQNMDSNTENFEDDISEENPTAAAAKNLVAILDEPIAPNSSLTKREYITRKFDANMMTGISNEPIYTLAFLNAVEQLALNQQAVFQKIVTEWHD